MSKVRGVSTRLHPDEVLELLPQQEPFRFVDEILEVDENHIVARYRFRPEAAFYRGHFPGDPITPGVILLESLAQVGVVAMGIYIYALEFGREEVARRVAFFTDANIDFSGVVKPGEQVTISAQKIFFRRGKLRAEASMTRDDGTVVCSGTISGLAVER
ncbi:MAG: 3-hydroxyacyl-ACP dehydratase FabZ family protein [Gemmatimonadota bacterium]|nr:3-hydroxyacyl-ACP dehydratase FabZ family protein [Gemmatimonadota bacterium]